MSLSDKEMKVLLRARLRNLKRKYAKLIQHSEITEQCLELKSDIDNLERQLQK